MLFHAFTRLFMTLAFLSAMEPALADAPSVAHAHVHKSTRASSDVTPFDIALFDFTPAATQPGLNFPIQSSDSCAGCHAPSGTPPLVADHVMPYPTWSGSMMANATRDPVFWAALDVANHDVPGVGDFCLRCHATKGWTAGRVVKTASSPPRTTSLSARPAACCKATTTTRTPTRMTAPAWPATSATAPKTRTQANRSTATATCSSMTPTATAAAAATGSNRAGTDRTPMAASRRTRRNPISTRCAATFVEIATM